MENFTPISGAIGGALIGLSATLMMWLTGRITGISGIFGGVLVPQKGEFSWRVTFLAGLLVGGVLLQLFFPGTMTFSLSGSWVLFAVAGLLVGFGTRMAGGCTSGHGICGLARFSGRSLVAVVTFMGAGGVAVYLLNHVFRGS